MNLELDGDLATFDGSHDGVRTRASPKLIIAPKSAELALRLAEIGGSFWRCCSPRAWPGADPPWLDVTHFF